MLNDGDMRSPTDAESTAYVGFDNVLHAIGSPRKFQITQVLIVVSCLIPYQFALFNFVFIGYEPPHVCAETNETELLDKYSLSNDTTANVVYEMCQIRITSNKTGHPKDVASTGCVGGYSYEGSHKDASFKTEWDLVCEKDGVAELVQTMLNVGMAVGSVTVNSLPDIFGRKYVILICGLLGTVFEFGVAFSPSINVVIGLKLLSGIVIQNLGFTPFVLGAELLVTRHRQVYALVTIILWACYLCILGGISYALRAMSWRVLQLVTSLSGIIPLLLVCFAKESISWLFAKGRNTEALKVIKHACVMNTSKVEVAVQAYDECVLRLNNTHENTDDNAQLKLAQYGFLDIIRHRRLLITSLVLCLTWFTHNLIYSGLYLTVATFNVNHYFMFMILAGTEIPSTIIFFLLLPYVGRRKIVLCFLSLSGVSLLVSTLLVGLGSPGSETINKASAAFFILGKFAISVSFTCVYSFTSEHFPTTLRNIGTGLCAFATRLGGVVAPLLYPLFRVVNWAPGTMLTALGLITVCFYTLVPETKDRELPTRIESVENLSGRRQQRKDRRC